MENNNNENQNQNEPILEKKKYVKQLEWKNDDENNNQKEKLHFPKRKYAIIHGYFGHDFRGNQK